MLETVDRIDDRTAVLDIFSYRNNNYIYISLIFFIILYHLLDCKIVSDRF